MNKFKKRIVFAGLMFAALGGAWYYTSHVHKPIYDFEFAHDINAVLSMFKEDWYWLDASRDEFESDYVTYKFKNKNPHLNPLTAGSMRIKVVREHDQTVGFITYHKEGADAGRILYLEVQKDFRRKQYGKMLVRHAMDDLIAMGSKKIRLVTRTDNLAAQKLYKSVGFVETSRSDGFVSFEYIVK